MLIPTCSALDEPWCQDKVEITMLIALRCFCCCWCNCECSTVQSCTTACASLYKSPIVSNPRAAEAPSHPAARSVHLLRALTRLVVLVVLHHRRSGDGTRDAPHHTLGLARLALRLLRIEIKLREEPGVGGEHHDTGVDRHSLDLARAPSEVRAHGDGVHDETPKHLGDLDDGDEGRDHLQHFLHRLEGHQTEVHVHDRVHEVVRHREPDTRSEI